MSKVTFQLPAVLEYQQRALFGPERYAVVEGATKVGKTYPAMVWLLTEAGKAPRPGRAYWWVAPTLGQAEMVFNRIRRMLVAANPDGSLWEASEQKKRIIVKGLGDFWFKTGEDPDNLYGEDVYAAVMDEFTRQREEAWHALRSTLTSTGGRCRFIGNVKGRKNWGYVLARKAQAGAENMSYAKITWRDAVAANIMPQSEVDDARNTLPAAVFRELYEAEPSEDGSNPFGLDHIARCATGMGLGPPVCFGVDLAKSVDYTVVHGLNAAGETCIFERWHGASWEHTENRVLSLIGDCPAWIDSTGVGDPIVERMQRRNSRIEGVKFTATSKQQLMERLAVCIQQGAVKFPDNEVRRELDTFEYVPTRTGVHYSAPTGLHDDCVCAIALACKGLDVTQTSGAFTFEVADMGETGTKQWENDW